MQAETVIEVNTGLKNASFRSKRSQGGQPRLLTRVQELRLLSKVEGLGLLSAGGFHGGPAARPPARPEISLAAHTPRSSPCRRGARSGRILHKIGTRA